jgi:hypothetical protein
VLKKLSEISHDETNYLVKKLFKKIVDLKENEHKKETEINELQVSNLIIVYKPIYSIFNFVFIIGYKIKLSEQNRLMTQLKQAMDFSQSDFERRLVDQKLKEEKSAKSFIEQLNECNNKISLMEREILHYKEQIIKLKTDTKILNGNESNNKNASVGFYLSQHSSFNKDAASFALKDGLTGRSNPLNEKSDDLSSDNNSTRIIKVHKKDLRKISQEDLLKRNQMK